MSEANQLFITSKKKEPKEYGDGKWGYFPFEPTFRAYQELSPAAFGLYMLLLKDNANHTRPLYKVEFEELTGKKKTVYYKALQDLKDKGYLVQNPDGGARWFFYPEGSDFSDT